MNIVSNVFATYDPHTHTYTHRLPKCGTKRNNNKAWSFNNRVEKNLCTVGASCYYYLSWMSTISTTIATVYLWNDRLCVFFCESSFLFALPLVYILAVPPPRSQSPNSLSFFSLNFASILLHLFSLPRLLHLQLFVVQYFVVFGIYPFQLNMHCIHNKSL